MSLLNTFLLGTSILTWLICNTAWIFFGAPTYYFGTAFIIFISSVIINSSTEKGTYQKLITEVFIFLALNNLIDELFFDATVIELNEYLAFILYLTYKICTRYYKK